MSHAIDGLDIAEEREEHMRNHPIISGASCAGCERLARKWDAWVAQEPCLKGTSAPHTEIDAALAELERT